MFDKHACAGDCVAVDPTVAGRTRADRVTYLGRRECPRCVPSGCVTAAGSVIRADTHKDLHS